MEDASWRSKDHASRGTERIRRKCDVEGKDPNCDVKEGQLEGAGVKKVEELTFVNSPRLSCS